MPLPRLPREGRPLGLLLAATGMFLVSTDSLFIRIADLDGWTIAFFASLWSTPVMWTIAARSLGRDLPGRFREFRTPLLASGFLGACSTTAFITAVTKTDVANVVAIIAAAPIFAAVFARIALGERTSPRTWLGIAGAVAGILVIVGGSLGGGGIGGDLLAVLAISIFGVNLTIWRRHPELPRTVLVALTATRYAPPAEVSLFTPIETVCGTAWAWIWFDEVPPTATFVGAAVVLAAVTYGVTGPAADVTPANTPHT